MTEVLRNVYVEDEGSRGPVEQFTVERYLGLSMSDRLLVAGKLASQFADLSTMHADFDGIDFMQASRFVTDQIGRPPAMSLPSGKIQLHHSFVQGRIAFFPAKWGDNHYKNLEVKNYPSIYVWEGLTDQATQFLGRIELPYYFTITPELSRHTQTKEPIFWSGTKKHRITGRNAQRMLAIVDGSVIKLLTVLEQLSSPEMYDASVAA